MAREFHVIAGKYQDFEDIQIEDIKYNKCVNSLEKAEEIIRDKKLTEYQICRIEVYGFD